MSNLVTIPKNGSLAKTKANAIKGFPFVSSFFDDMFLEDFPSLFSSNFNAGVSLPKVNIKETEDSFHVEMAVPGMKKSDFQINLDENVLSVSTELEEENEVNETGFTRREFGYSSFRRTFTLPDTVDDNKILAEYNEGILSIKLPKKEEAKKKPARTIKIS